MRRPSIGGLAATFGAARLDVPLEVEAQLRREPRHVDGGNIMANAIVCADPIEWAWVCWCALAAMVLLVVFGDHRLEVCPNVGALAVPAAKVAKVDRQPLGTKAAVGPRRLDQLEPEYLWRNGLGRLDREAEGLVAWSFHLVLDDGKDVRQV